MGDQPTVLQITYLQTDANRNGAIEEYELAVSIYYCNEFEWSAVFAVGQWYWKR